MTNHNKAQGTKSESALKRSPQPVVEASASLPRQGHPAPAFRSVDAAHLRAVTPADILNLQRSVGNRAVRRLLAGKVQRHPLTATPQSLTQPRLTGEQQPGGADFGVAQARPGDAPGGASRTIQARPFDAGTAHASAGKVIQRQFDLGEQKKTAAGHYNPLKQLLTGSAWGASADALIQKFAVSPHFDGLESVRTLLASLAIPIMSNEVIVDAILAAVDAAGGADNLSNLWAHAEVGAGNYVSIGEVPAFHQAVQAAGGLDAYTQLRNDLNLPLSRESHAALQNLLSKTTGGPQIQQLHLAIQSPAMLIRLVQAYGSGDAVAVLIARAQGTTVAYICSVVDTAPAVEEMIDWSRPDYNLADLMPEAGNFWPTLKIQLAKVGGPDELQQWALGGRTSVVTLVKLLTRIGTLDEVEALLDVTPPDQGATLLQLLTRVQVLAKLRELLNTVGNQGGLLNELLGQTQTVAQLEGLLTMGVSAARLNYLLGQVALLHSPEIINHYRAHPEQVVDAGAQENYWDRGTFGSPVQSILYHYYIHVVGWKPDITIDDYTRMARGLRSEKGFEEVGGSGADTYKMLSWTSTRGGIFTSAEDKIVSAWYNQKRTS